MRGRVKRFIQNFLDTFYSLSKSIKGVGVDFTDLIIVERESCYLNMIKLMKSNYLQLGDGILEKKSLPTLLKPQKAPSFIMEMLFWLRLMWSSSLIRINLISILSIT